jgi:hypothetical protein
LSVAPTPQGGVGKCRPEGRRYESN